ncbi:MAG: glycosyl hydrolase family 18 protein [Bacillota bacterium]|nr:glycosyl hydrolase family 18 protein [Bacillota bacterium]
MSFSRGRNISLVAAVMALLFIVPSGVQAAVLQRGDTGPLVRSLQQSLAKAGFYSGPVTGYFGSMTRASVVGFQRASGVRADGVVGPMTQRALTVKNSPAPGSTMPPAPSSTPPVELPPAAPLSATGPEVVAYYCQYHAADMLSRDSLKKHGKGIIDGVAAAIYSVTPSGEVVGGDCGALMEAAKSTGAKPLALVSNIYGGKFDKNTVHTVLANAGVRGKTIENIAKILKNGGFYGVNIDFENVDPADRQMYTDFVGALAQRIKPEGFMMTISVPAKKREDPSNSWSAAFDYWSLGKIADRVMIMTYDEHWSTALPGPVASVEWVEMMLKFATSAIPSHKILMGLPAYGYDWPVGSRLSKSVRSYEAVELVKTGQVQAGWDDVARVPFYTYVSGRQRRIAYYEDAKSAAFKIDLVSKYKLGGIAIWRLGYEDPGLWSVIQEKMKPAPAAQSTAQGPGATAPGATMGVPPAAPAGGTPKPGGR